MRGSDKYWIDIGAELSRFRCRVRGCELVVVGAFCLSLGFGAVALYRATVAERRTREIVEALQAAAPQRTLTGERLEGLLGPRGGAVGDIIDAVLPPQRGRPLQGRRR